MEWQARWARGLKYEVSHKNRMFVERFVVDLLAGICSCKFWRLCEMSCPYDCCAIFYKGAMQKITATTSIGQQPILQLMSEARKTKDGEDQRT
ncbi:hypothetical protein Ahy_A08g039673 [Arachis hypogaea]|uniref:Uncharacterized protein n=1 Tax=Arachis hypogaea TaxID=3818 RepID=A0A445BXG5_ARAHY|nr:hypothetical protein Ahy_A08g039673 [Arachis hypogaea]